ncbi:hypothetical protein BS47DRAFT_1356841 [Hydnum rufescens UP504]|uniref:Uncharacterized protein n=1 Tax=Hydnum rufescens UP504 TaxID=1448309 RepID=A0A9P6DFA1_9AGAM|nr:hypothetical protein BS47DRAFT_1356841 [Hydnum rufescens UP504]
MSEPFRVQLSALQHLLQHIPDSLTLPQQSEAVYPFTHYSIDQDWLKKIESEGGVVNRDLELAFADRIVQKDTLGCLITFHEHGPSWPNGLSSTLVEGAPEGLREHAAIGVVTKATTGGPKVFMVEEEIVFFLAV